MSRDSQTNARDRYVEQLIEEGSAIALPELRATSLPDALYRVRDRGGLGAVAIPETALADRQLDALARLRFGQFMAAGCFDEEAAFRERLDRCPLPTYTSPETVHFVVFAAATGELLASMCMVGPPPAAPHVRVATRNRALLPVEEQFGWGPFNRLERVADTPIERMREYGRLVKNLRHRAAGPRAIVELILAPMRLPQRGLPGSGARVDAGRCGRGARRVRRRAVAALVPRAATRREGSSCTATRAPSRTGARAGEAG
jgi:hypothetical protein